MQISLNPLIALPIAVVALAAFVGIWYYLLRPVPGQQQAGTVEHIEFAARETVTKTEMRSLRNADDLVKKKQYTLPDRFIYTIKLEDGRVVRYLENALHAEAEPEHAVGDKIQVSYQVRKLPLGKEKILVNDLKR